MNFPETETQKQEQQDYTFMSGDDALKSLVDEMDEQRDGVNDDEFKPPQITKIATESDPPPPSKSAVSSSETLVKVIDDVLARGLGMYAKTDYRQLKAGNDDIKEISKHLAPYMGPDKLPIPEWFWGVVAASTVLFDKFKTAGEIRKLNLANEKKDRKIRDLENRIVEREKSIKELELQEKEDKLKEKIKNLTPDDGDSSKN